MFHITRRRNLESIFENGLKPQGDIFGGFKRARSTVQRAVYLFETEHEARMGGSSQFWQNPDPDEWHIIEVEIPDYCNLKRDPEFSSQSRINAWMASCTIPPEYLTYLYPVMSEE